WTAQAGAASHVKRQMTLGRSGIHSGKRVYDQLRSSVIQSLQLLIEDSGKGVDARRDVSVRRAGRYILAGARCKQVLSDRVIRLIGKPLPIHLCCGIELPQRVVRDSKQPSGLGM